LERKQDLSTVDFVSKKAKIKVIGVGGGGCNAINRMIEMGVNGVDFLAINTDAQSLETSISPVKLQIGTKLTGGLGTGSDPQMGRQAAEESKEAIQEAIAGADMIFITAGFGGGTGTGASPLIAELARETGALTVAVLTKPFNFEGKRRREIAENGLKELQTRVDTLITISNERLLEILDKRITFVEAMKIVDDILRQSVQGITDIITYPGMINVDFADVNTIMRNAGTAWMGIGKASGEKRAEEAAKAAISNPLLETTLEGARGVLFCLMAGENFGLLELSEAANVITTLAAPDALIIHGAAIDPSMGDEVKLIIIATGFGPARGASKEEKAEDKSIFTTLRRPPLVTGDNIDIPAFLRARSKKAIPEVVEEESE